LKQITKMDNSSSRTSLDYACKNIFEQLIKEQKYYSVTSLARELKLHRNTVEKCIEMLLVLEKMGLEQYKINLQTVDNKKIIGLEKRTGLLSYPKDIQNLIIRARHFPLPSDESYVLVNLYLKEAKTSKQGVKLNKDKTVEKLIKQGQIKESRNGSLYLSDEGIIIAEGTLDMFPNLKDHKQEKDPKRKK
jgi:DNA-binding transcriptional regulator YhcF (GntR family)